MKKQIKSPHQWMVSDLSKEADCKVCATFSIHKWRLEHRLFHKVPNGYTQQPTFQLTIEEDIRTIHRQQTRESVEGTCPLSSSRRQNRATSRLQYPRMAFGRRHKDLRPGRISAPLSADGLSANKETGNKKEGERLLQ